MSNPSNVLIHVRKPLFIENSSKNIVTQDINSFSSEILKTLKNQTRSYGFVVENSQDFDDIDSILLGLRIDPELLIKYPGFDSWKSNPLFGLEQEKIDKLLASHHFAEPAWLRNEEAVSMRLMSVAPEGAADFMPAIALGLPNFASHLALLAVLGKHAIRGEVVVFSNHDVEVNFVTEIQGVSVLVFSTRVNYENTGSHGQLTALRGAARSDVALPVAIIVPASERAFEAFLPPPPLAAVRQFISEAVAQQCKFLTLHVREGDLETAPTKEYGDWSRAMKLVA